MPKVVTKQFKLAVSELQQQIRTNIDDLNVGGCGYFCKYVNETLKELGIESKIKIIDEDLGDFRRKQALLNDLVKGVENVELKHNIPKYRTSFSHAFIQVGSLRFDGLSLGKDITDFFFRRYRDKVYGNYTIEQLNKALEVGGWNHSYDTSQNRKLKKIIRNTFIKYLSNNNLK